MKKRNKLNASIKKRNHQVWFCRIYYFVGVIPGTERSYSRDLELIFYMGANNFQIRVYSFRVIERRASFSQLLMECIWFFFLCRLYGKRWPFDIFIYFDELTYYL